MSDRHTFIRSLHDLGIAAWFGGSLMGAVGVNGGAAEAKDPTERLRISSAGWAKWTPVQLAVIAAHGIGGIGLVLTNKKRLTVQDEARSNAVVKTIITAAAGAASVIGGAAGAAIAKHADEGGAGVTEPSATASNALRTAQRIEKVTQWAIPVLTGLIIVLSAQQGEQQRPVAGLLHTVRRKARQSVR